MPNKNVSNSTSEGRSSITGTSDSTGRKMRSPPGNIFVWGVYPSTTTNDIVNGLTESGIHIDAKDIVKKSKPVAFLSFFL